jgi:hypothetical protein
MMDARSRQLNMKGQKLPRTRTHGESPASGFCHCWPITGVEDESLIEACLHFASIGIEQN